jgi:putative molybdopterin biosynthesis protein
VQQQFLDVIDRDEAERRFHAALDLRPLGPEDVPLQEALGRVLAADVVALMDVPSFDRSNFDGYAVRAADTYGAGEEDPRRLRLLDEVLATGVVPRQAVGPGQAVSIATGGMLPRGADAVVMVEHTDAEGAELRVTRAVTPGAGVSFAGTDVAAGETVLRRGELLSSRETGVLAAIGAARVAVWRRPRVAILSTGDEIIGPGQPMRPGLVYDSNARIIADAVRELGGEPLELGIVRDDLDRLRTRLAEALGQADVVLLSGGTSKGEGDLSYRAVRELGEPGIVAHGVALKPGKPICLAAHRGRAVVILPGFPTSAIFTFHEFVAPVILALAGRSAAARSTVDARLAVKVNSEIGRTEYLLVGLVPGSGGLAAYPMGGGSGSVTTFSRADGFVTIGRHEEIIPAGSLVRVQLLGAGLRPADLVVIGSHCVGLDLLLGLLQDEGFHTKFMAVGSTAGLEAARRGECDMAGMHLLDPKTGQYNRPYLTPELELVEGYGRLQGVVFRPGDTRFEGRDAAEAIRAAANDPDCVMVNRNPGSGTRILIDRLLDGLEPPGYAVQARSHNAVAAAVVQGRADWGVAIQWVARHNGLGFLPLEEEHYDFAVPKDRLDRPAVAALRRLLTEAAVRDELARMGFRRNDERCVVNDELREG